MKTSELLAAAADAIERHGHTKGELARRSGPDYGPMCLVGALNFIANGDPHKHDTIAHKKSRRYLEQLLDLPKAPINMPLAPIVDWNNNDKRTQDEVVRALREAASMAATDEAA